MTFYPELSVSLVICVQEKWAKTQTGTQNDCYNVGEVQLHHEMLHCFAELRKPGKKNNYHPIYIGSTQKAPHTKGFCLHKSKWYKQGVDKVKLQV